LTYVSFTADVLDPAFMLWYAEAKNTIQLSLGSEIGRIERELPILN
jgi:hypothetical protein